MKKVMRFIKRRICPIMLALVIVFFSVVEAQASPAPVLPPTFEVIPGGGSITYFDVSQAIFGATGFDIRMVEEDGTPKSFEKELWDEMVDLFDIWAVQNFGTSDFEEIDAEIRGVIVDAVDGTISMSKKLFEALQQYASEAYDYIYDYLNSGDYVDDSGSIPWTFLLAAGADCIPSAYSTSSVMYSYNHYILLSQYDRYGTLYYYLYISRSDCYHVVTPGDGVAYFHFYNSLDNRWDHNLGSTNWLRWCSSDSYPNGDYGTMLATSRPWNIVSTDMVNISGLCDFGSTPDSIPNLPRFPVEHITFDPESVPVPWDEVAPIEDPDRVKIPVPHKEVDPDPEEEEDPDPPPPPEDEDPDPEEEEDPDPPPPPEDEDPEEDVTEEEIGTLPDIVTSAGDVTKLFPFCIPFDIVALIKSMQTEKKPPVWHFEYYFKDIDYTFEVTIDMTDYEAYVKVFRSGFVILYIITLMLLTIRYSTGIVKD